MTFIDWTRSHLLLGYVAARLVDGNFRLAEFDVVIGVLLILAMRTLDPYVLGTK